MNHFSMNFALSLGSCIAKQFLLCKKKGSHVPLNSPSTMLSALIICTGNVHVSALNHKVSKSYIQSTFRTLFTARSNKQTQQFQCLILTCINNQNFIVTLRFVYILILNKQHRLFIIRICSFFFSMHWQVWNKLSVVCLQHGQRADNLACYVVS